TIFGVLLMISGYIVIKLGKTFEKGISWACVAFGIGILARFLIETIYHSPFEVSTIPIAIGVLDITHGLIGTGILIPKNTRERLRILFGELVEIYAIATIAGSVYISDGIAMAISMGILSEAWGIIFGGKWKFLGGVL